MTGADIVGFLAVECHQQHDTIMRMTLPEAAMYFEYAGEHPPVSYMVAAYFGVKPKGKPKPSDLDDLVNMFGGPGPIR